MLAMHDLLQTGPCGRLAARATNCLYSLRERVNCRPQFLQVNETGIGFRQSAQRTCDPCFGNLWPHFSQNLSGRFSIRILKAPTTWPTSSRLQPSDCANREASPRLRTFLPESSA
jgi:hypothetical protein